MTTLHPGMTIRFVIVMTLLAIIGCASREVSPEPSVGAAWRDHAVSTTAAKAPTATQDQSPPASQQNRENSAPAASTSAAIGFVNGIEVPRHRVLNLLLKSRGPRVFEQVAMLAVVERLANDRGLTVSESDVNTEYDITLRTLTDPLAGMGHDAFDATKARELLNAILARRDVSHEEFMLGVRRNAILRRIVEADLEVTEAQLRAAYRHRHGSRVQVRHIQLATPAEVARIKKALAQGQNFAMLAQQYSANSASAARGGLLEPFSLDDPDVPAAMRTAAAALDDSTPSDAVRVGEWYHLLRLERHVPPDQVPFAEVRPDLEREIRRREADPKIRALYQELFEKADIDIADPILRESFGEAFPGHR